MGRFQPSLVVWQKEDLEAAGLLSSKNMGLFILNMLYPYPLLNHITSQTFVSQLFVRRHVASPFEILSSKIELRKKNKARHKEQGSREENALKGQKLV